MASNEREAYETYEGFLKATIREYWESGRASRINFLALLLASREAWSVAWTGATGPGGGKKILTGAAGAAAVAFLLRTFVGGPIGIILGGATIASLVGLYVRNHRHIWAKVDHYRVLLEQYRTRFDDVRDNYLHDRIDRDQRDLMMDGLMSRLLDELDAYEPEEEAEAEPSAGGFAAHAARRRAEEERDKERERQTKPRDDSQT